ncbi:MAG: hypothetical protein ACTTKL_09520 [Treponema sp.]
MEFYINGEKADISLENEKTVGDVFKSFALVCEENDVAAVEIFVDGKQIGVKQFDQEAVKPLLENTKFEFTVVSKAQVFAALKNFAPEFKTLCEKITEIPAAMQSGKDAAVNTIIISLADKIEDFCRISSFASFFDGDSSILADGQSLSEFFGGFSSILSDFEDALKNTDAVGIQDLAEYEIMPRLESLIDTLENLE